MVDNALALRGANPPINALGAFSEGAKTAVGIEGAKLQQAAKTMEMIGAGAMHALGGNINGEVDPAKYKEVMDSFEAMGVDVSRFRDNPQFAKIAAQASVSALDRLKLARSDRDYELALQKFERDIEKGAKRSLQPVYGTDADGKTVLLQVGDDGTAVRTEIPEGIDISTGIEKVDMGDRIMFRDKRSGQIIGVESKGGSPSADQRPTDDGGLEAIPGSTLDVERRQESAADEQRRLQRQTSQQRAGQTVLRAVNRGMKEFLPNVISGEGVVASNARAAAAKVRGTAEWNLLREIEDFKSNIGLDRLQQMREESPTGGALGQVPFQQQQRLERVLGDFDVGAPLNVLEENLKQINNIYLDIMFGSAKERQAAVKAGRMSPEESAEIDSKYMEVEYDQFGRSDGDDDQPPASLEGVPRSDIKKINGKWYVKKDGKVFEVTE